MWRPRKFARAFGVVWLCSALAIPFPSLAQSPPLNPDEERGALQAIERVPILEDKAAEAEKVIGEKNITIEEKNKALTAKDDVIASKDATIAALKETQAALADLLNVKEQKAAFYKELAAANQLKAEDERKARERQEAWEPWLRLAIGLAAGVGGFYAGRR